MTKDDLSLLDRLKAILTKRMSVSVEAVDNLGLLLAPTLVPSAYSGTPIDCIPFAYTGGDGVHFSFADTGEATLNSSPVTMTVPMCFDRPNRVVGRDLKEFLALGLRTGYFVLEQLQYSPERMIARLEEQDFASGLHPMEIETLRDIERVF